MPAIVLTDYPGAAPEVVETEVTRKIEESVNTIAGISQLFSRSYEGSSVVIVSSIFLVTSLSTTSGAAPGSRSPGSPGLIRPARRSSRWP